MKKIIIFGASGDLAKRKIFPSLSKLKLKGTEIIGYARSDLEESFDKELEKFYDYKPDFLKHVKYIRGSYDDLSPLKSISDENTSYYLSVPPSVYFSVIEKINELKYEKILIEKPFAEDVSELKRMSMFDIGKLIFIDHYYINPLVIALPGLLDDSLKDLYKIMNKDNVYSVQGFFNEQLLAEGREYFDKYGFVRDVMENHLFICLISTLYSAEKNDSTAHSVVRKNIAEKFSIDEKKCIFGQYSGYKDEFHRETETETFALLGLKYDCLDWENVPFILCGGKGLKEKSTKIVFKFRKESFHKFNSYLDGILEEFNSIDLVFEFSPKALIYISINGDNIRKVIKDNQMIKSTLSKVYSEYQGYQIIFEQLINGKHFHSGSYEEILVYLKLFSNVKNIKRNLFYYKPGSTLPQDFNTI